MDKINLGGNMKYNTNDLYLYDIFKVLYKEYYYDAEFDEYLQDIYYTFEGLKLVLKKDNKLIDVLEDKELLPFSFGMKNGDEFTFKTYPLALTNYIKDDYKNKLINKQLVESLEYQLVGNLMPDLEKLQDNIYLITGPYTLDKYSIIEYYNDHDKDDYYDELKEYRKSLIYRYKNNQNNRIHTNKEYFM